MATSLRKICKIVRRLGGCGECEFGSRCLWSEFQSSQSVCFLALKYFLFLPPWFTGSWGGWILLLFWNVSLPTSERENNCSDRRVPWDLGFKGGRAPPLESQLLSGPYENQMGCLNFLLFLKGQINLKVTKQSFCHCHGPNHPPPWFSGQTLCVSGTAALDSTYERKFEVF